MREVDQKDYTFSNDDYLSVFAGVCKSEELLDKYMKKDYPDNLDRPFNVAIVIGRLKYEGEIKEVQNDEFGYFETMKKSL